MQLLPMSDLVIVLPGVMGSVLRKDNRDIWSLSPTLVPWLLQRDALAEQLKLAAPDDPSLDDLGDGVQAVRLMPSLHMIPGLWKIDGYNAIFDYLQNTFDVTLGQIDQHNPQANLFPFPYDWRRDNRVAARKLKRFVDEQLPLWRKASGVVDAKVILIAHSMGGLISRHYLEVLGGWEYCRALFTLGTPHRGAVNALNFLSNGHRLLRADVTEALRSFDSVYQLLPNYRVIESGGSYIRASEADALFGISRRRAEQAQAFHDEIAEAARSRIAASQGNAYWTFPVMGVRQPTLQSASVHEGRIVGSTNLPSTLRQRNIPGGGDGTVPYFSAIPAELVDEHRELSVAEQHGSLQANNGLLDQIHFKLAQLAVRDWGGVLGPGNTPAQGPSPAIGMALDDAFHETEPIQIRAELFDAAESTVLECEVTALDSSLPPSLHPMQQQDDGWQALLEPLPPGLYRLAVRSQSLAPGTPSSVNTFFEVVP